MIRTSGRTNCLDASALVKLVVAEERSEKLQTYLAKEANWYTTPFCFYEALNVLKAKYMHKNKITENEYEKASFDLMADFQGCKKYLPDLDLTDVLTFSDTQNLCKKHGLDLSDAFQNSEHQKRLSVCR